VVRSIHQVAPQSV